MITTDFVTVYEAHDLETSWTNRLLFLHYQFILFAILNMFYSRQSGGIDCKGNLICVQKVNVMCYYKIYK